MAKALEDMTLEELWELFPVALVEHKDSWAEQFREMELRLQGLLTGFGNVRISHIGSTAIAGIKAKDIVDVLVELDGQEALERAALILERDGFIRMSSEPGRISLNFGYTPDGFAAEVFHVHLRLGGDNDELLFRDYLNAHPEVAGAYEELKVALQKQYEHDRDAYTAGKDSFVAKWTAEARNNRAPI